jgi:hypothetical protein
MKGKMFENFVIFQLLAFGKKKLGKTERNKSFIVLNKSFIQTLYP